MVTESITELTYDTETAINILILQKPPFLENRNTKQVKWNKMSYNIDLVNLI